MKYLISAIILSFLAFGFWYACNREAFRGHINQPTPAEKQKQGQQTRDVIARSVYSADTAKAGTQIRALQRELKAATSKDKAATAKAQHSASVFAKSGKVEDCRDALTDCQEENATKAYSILVQDRMLAAADSTQKRHVSEIDRRGSVIDSAFAGWGQANEALRKASKRKPWGISGFAGYGAGKDGLSPFVGIGISYNFKTF